MSDVLIRPMELRDVPAVSIVASRTYATTFGGSMSAADLELQLCATRSEAYFRKIALSDTILVAVVDNAIVGYVQISDVRIPVNAAAEDQEIFALYVDVGRQGQGFGAALMDAALAHERLTRAPHVYLDVWDANVRAIALYERCGFRVVGRRDFRINERVLGSDLVMVRQRS